MLSARLVTAKRFPTRRYPVGQHVYVVEADGLWKIGMTAHVSSRLGSLRSEHRCTLVHLIATDHAPALEAILHHRFRHRWVRGEWFCLVEEDLDWLCALEYVVCPIDIRGTSPPPEVDQGRGARAWWADHIEARKALLPGQQLDPHWRAKLQRERRKAARSVRLRVPTSRWAPTRPQHPTWTYVPILHGESTESWRARWRTINIKT